MPQALNMLARFDAVPDADPRWWHRMAEVLKRVSRDRLRHLGDRDFADVPIDRLLSVDYAAGRVVDLHQFWDRVDDAPAAAGPAMPELGHGMCGLDPRRRGSGR